MVIDIMQLCRKRNNAPSNVIIDISTDTKLIDTYKVGKLLSHIRAGSNFHYYAEIIHDYNAVEIATYYH